jgi:hypothetical protein
MQYMYLKNWRLEGLIADRAIQNVHAHCDTLLLVSTTSH